MYGSVSEFVFNSGVTSVVESGATVTMTTTTILSGGTEKAANWPI